MTNKQLARVFHLAADLIASGDTFCGKPIGMCSAIVKACYQLKIYSSRFDAIQWLRIYAYDAYIIGEVYWFDDFSDTSQSCRYMMLKWIAWSLEDE